MSSPEMTLPFSIQVFTRLRRASSVKVRHQRDGGSRKMLDLVIKGGRIIDGTGAPARSGDVGIADGRIVQVGKVASPARQEIDADGALVTPGFIDLHTHYDGQFTWDDTLEPSFSHGVTTVVGGNCGVGFAPVRPDGR